MSIDKNVNYSGNKKSGLKGDMASGVSGGSVEAGLAGRESINTDACRTELGMVPSGTNQAPTSPKGGMFK
jgi:hypothetical protein